METKRTHEELTEILDRTTGWIENCDSKASIILSGAGVVAGILLATDYVEKIIAIYRYMTDNASLWTVSYLVCNILSIGAFVTGCLLLIGVLIARVKPVEFSDKGVKTDSLIFFSSIAANKSLAKYREKIKKCSSEQLDDDIISQIYICSLICEKKFALYKNGLIISLAGFAGFAIMTIIGVVVV